MKRKKIFNKFAAIAVSAALIIGSVAGKPVRKAEAATQNDAVAWANAQIGKGLDYDGMYGNQCVDLIKYYYDYFGVAGYAKGNANEYIVNDLPAGWVRVYDNYQPGDIAVWKVNHSCNTCSTGAYGHVGIITSADSVGFNAVNQNFNSKAYCTQNWFNCSALACAIRPSFTASAQPAPAAGVSFGDFNQNGVWDTNAEMYVKVLNPNKETVTAVGCYLYDANGAMVKSYTESCSYNLSYVNYNCNINNDMKYTLAPGTTYKFELYAIVGGKEYKDAMRSFTTTGNSDQEKPVITDVSVYDQSETGYKVKCKASDNVGVVRVQFPTWTSANGQDDIQAEWWDNVQASGKKDSDGYYVYEVKISEHNDELGVYNTHIYAYDKVGNSDCYIVPAVTVEKGAEPAIQPQNTPGMNEQPDITPVPMLNATPAPDVTPIPMLNATPAPDVTPIPILNATPAPDVTPVPIASATPMPVITPEPFDSEAADSGYPIVIGLTDTSVSLLYAMPSQDLTEVGMYIGTDPTAPDYQFGTNLNANPNSPVGLMMWSSSDTNYYLQPDTTYYFYFYYTSNNKTTASKLFSFTTNKSNRSSSSDFNSITATSVRDDGAGFIVSIPPQNLSHWGYYYGTTIDTMTKMKGGNNWGYEISEMNLLMRDLAPDTTYYFYVYYVTTDSKIVLSPVNIFKTAAKDNNTNSNNNNDSNNNSKPAVTAPEKVFLSSVSSFKKKSMLVLWYSINEVDGYQLQYATNKKFKSPKSIAINSWKISKKTISKLKSKKKYYVRVRAYRFGDGKKKLYGKWSKVKGCKIK